MNHLAHQPEFRLHLIREITECMLETHIEDIRAVEAETIDIEGIDPVLHHIDQVLSDGFTVKIQLRELPGTTPCTVVEAVAPWRAAIEADALVPVLIRAVPAILLDILKCEEAAAGVVEYCIDDDTDTIVVRSVHEVTEVFIGPESAIDGSIIRRVVAMTSGFEKRADVDGIAAEYLQIRDIRIEFREAVTDFSTIVLLFGPHHAEGIHMIKDSTVKPGHIHLHKKAGARMFRRITSHVLPAADASGEF